MGVVIAVHDLDHMEEQVEARQMLHASKKPDIHDRLGAGCPEGTGGNGAAINRHPIVLAERNQSPCPFRRHCHQAHSVLADLERAVVLVQSTAENGQHERLRARRPCR